jgi:hypothetical protein
VATISDGIVTVVVVVVVVVVATPLGVDELG